MLNITDTQATAAAANDREAVRAVLTALEPTFRYYAKDAATVNGHCDYQVVDDYAQDAAVAVMMALPNFDGETVAELVRYVNRYIIDAVSKGRRVESTKGVSYDISDHAMRTYERALQMAGGNADEAEKLAQDVDRFTEQYALSADNARQARMARQPVVSLDSSENEKDHGATKKSRMTPQRREDIRRVREVLATLTPKQQRVIKMALGINDASEFGVTFGVSRKGVSKGKLVCKLADSKGMGEELELTANNVTMTWRQALKAFEKAWIAAYGVPSLTKLPAPVDPDLGAVSEEEAALVAAVEANDEGTYLHFHMAAEEVEVIAYNDEADAVVTWLSIRRAQVLGVLYGESE